MEKRGVLTLSLLVSVFFINLVSAYGSYGYFSLGNFINSLNPLEILAYGSVFIILFALVRKGLSRGPFGDSLGRITTTGSIVSAAVSFLIMYLFLYRTNFNIPNAVSGIGVPTDFLYPLFGIIFVLGVLYLIWKISFCKFLMLTGASLFALTFTDWIYEKGIAGTIGFILFVVGLWWCWKRRRRMGGALGSTSGHLLNQWPNNQNQNAQTNQQPNGIPRLIAEARAYRNWADRQSNPAMLRNWAHFIKYLKGRGYGNSEKDICQRINITPKDIQKAVKKYIL